MTNIMLIVGSIGVVGGGARVVVSIAAFHARIRGSVPGLCEKTKMFLPHPRVKLCIVGSLRDREVACSASDRQGSNLEYCFWRTVSSHSSHHPQEVLLAQFSLYVHKGGLKPDSFHIIYRCGWVVQLAVTPHWCVNRGRVGGAHWPLHNIHTTPHLQIIFLKAIINIMDLWSPVGSFSEREFWTFAWHTSQRPPAQ